jgi:hypothetical protein
MIRRNTNDEKVLRRIEFRFIREEISDFAKFRRLCLSQDQRNRLREMAGICSRALEDRLYQAGFLSENVLAMELFPIAKTAWASGSVTISEREELMDILRELDQNNPPEVKELFSEWLIKEPANRLWNLWEQFTLARANALPSDLAFERARNVYSACVRVARASGGIFGIGKVSPAEQRVLKKVKSVYQKMHQAL